VAELGGAGGNADACGRYACTLCIGAAFCPQCYSSSERLTCHVPPLLLRCPLALDEMVKQAEVRQQWQEQVRLVV
jgi:hypothetical protein